MEPPLENKAPIKGRIALKEPKQNAHHELQPPCTIPHEGAIPAWAYATQGTAEGCSEEYSAISLTHSSISSSYQEAELQSLRPI